MVVERMMRPTVLLVVATLAAEGVAGEPIAPAVSEPGVAIRPAERDGLSAKMLADGRPQMENEFLRVVFDPSDMGAAASLFYKLSGKELAGSQTYTGRWYKAFQEFLHIGELPEGPTGVAYKLLYLSLKDNEAVATFTGFPYVAPASATPEQQACAKIRVEKTYRLRAGASKLDVHVRAINENPLPVNEALRLHSGMQIEKEGITNFLPAPFGTYVSEEAWITEYSTRVQGRLLSEPWTAVCGRDAAKTGLYLVTTPDMEDVFENFLIKFPGFELQIGTPMVTIPAGKEIAVHYSCVAMRGLSRVDSATDQLACGIEVKTTAVKARTPLDVRVGIASASAAEAQLSFRLRRLPDAAAQEKEVGNAKLRCEPGTAAFATFPIQLPYDDSTYVLAAVVTAPGSKEFRAEYPLSVGASSQKYWRPSAKTAGAAYWSNRREERSMPPHAQDVDRTVKLPMVPWNAPAAGAPKKALFIADWNWTTGIARDLGRRSGMQWDLVNMMGSRGANVGPYRWHAIDLVRDKLDVTKPDVILTAGTRFADAPPLLMDCLLAAVREGSGLVLVSVPGNTAQEGLWPQTLTRPDFVKQDVDLLGPMAPLFADNVAAPAPLTEVYAHGRGRIVRLIRQVDTSRNNLLPRNRGRTPLPAWEYNFADYVQALRYAAGIQPPVSVRDIRLTRGGLEVICEAHAARTATLEYDIVATDLSWAEQGRKLVHLTPGRQTATVTTPERPGNEYVLHAWLLDGKAPEEHKVSGNGEVFLYREAHAAAVLDFTASLAKLASPVPIAGVEVEGMDGPVPQAIRVRLGGDQRTPTKVAVRAELANGERCRIVWRGVARAQSGGEVSFQDIAYQPVGPENSLAVEVRNDDHELLTRKRVEWRTREIKTFATDEFAFVISNDGTQEDWYAREMFMPWIRSAGVAAFLPYNLGPAVYFPWVRNPADWTLKPPIVDEDTVRKPLAQALRASFARGVPYVPLSDEFRLGGEYDFSEATLKVFRDHLRAQYGTLEALNQSWGEKYQTFDEVKPILAQAARQRLDRPAAWMDFRLFMDDRCNRRLEIAAEEAAKISPMMRIGESGMYGPDGLRGGVNFYKMGQASRFLVAYDQIRDAWARAFISPGGIVGTWMGYGSQEPVDCWRKLFQGNQFIGWWALMSGADMSGIGVESVSLTPNGKYADVGLQQREILRGLGRLFRHAQPTHAVFLSYSQVSAYMLSLLGPTRYEDASAPAVSLMDSLAMPYSFIADEQAEQGRLDGMKDKVFLLGGAVAMPAGTARAYAAAWDRGCTLIGDAGVAMRDGHGTRLTSGALDETFGISRGQSAPARSPESIAWTAAAPAGLRSVSGSLTKAFADLRANGGEAWATFPDGTPAIVARRSKAGSWAAYLNTKIEWLGVTVGKDRRPEAPPGQLPPSETVREVLGRLAAEAGIRAPVRVEPTDKSPIMAGAFADGRARYYGVLLRDASNSYAVTVSLPEAAHTYDIRAKRYLGKTTRFSDNFDPRLLAKVYGQLPYAVKELVAAVDAPNKLGGETVTLSGQVVAQGGEATEFHVIRCEVVAPDGARPTYWQQNLSAPAGKFSTALPLALNEQPGRWRVELTDAMSGVTTTVEFTVEAAAP